jgi:endonuclease YncB( thermonuclease family)
MPFAACKRSLSQRLARCALACLAAVALMSLTHPSAARAATCSQYSNQADAQRAADTRDADGDGIYCESLPCPCSKGATTPPAATPAPARPVPAGQTKFKGVISKVVDGDTIWVKSGAYRIKVRLLGIDSPEQTVSRFGHRECGGAQATAYMRRIAPLGTPVTLTTDPTQDRTDRYGRLLAYARTERQGILQLRMLEAGWAKVYVYGGRRFTRTSQFSAAAIKAYRARRGVHADCGGSFRRPAK